MTVADMRRRSLIEVAKRKNPEPTEQDLADARTIMNRFYRLHALHERLFYLENDSIMVEKHQRYIKSLQSRFERLDKKLNEDLVPYNLITRIAWISLDLYEPDEYKGCVKNVYLTHFYQQES